MSVRATMVQDIDHAKHLPGAIELYADGLYYVCPCGCRAVGYLAFKPAPSPSWEWNCSTDKPTLKPSIDHKIRQPDGSLSGSHWHGFLTVGIWHSPHDHRDPNYQESQ